MRTSPYYTRPPTLADCIMLAAAQMPRDSLGKSAQRRASEKNKRDFGRTLTRAEAVRVRELWRGGERDIHAMAAQFEVHPKQIRAALTTIRYGAAA